MRLLHPIVALSLGLVVAACGSDEEKPKPDTTPTDTSEVVEDPCLPLTLENLGTLVLDGQDDVSTSYSYPLVDAQFSAPLPDFLVMQFINYNERIDALGAGTFALDQAPNDNFGTCPECIAIWVDQSNPSAPVGKILFQSAGTITLELNPRTKRLKGKIEGLRFQEIDIDEMTLSSTFVEGGLCARMTETITFDFKYVPPEWKCVPATYYDGNKCNCDCGTTDPDCYPLESDPAVVSSDCESSELCYLGKCTATCSNADPKVGCATGEFCKPEMPSDMCQPRTGTVSSVHVGDPCLGSTSVYCEPIGSNIGGICDIDAETKTCEPLCEVRQDCAANEYCYTIVGSADGSGKGFCHEGVHPNWFLCDDAKYNDGATCDCGCGVDDPDCDAGDKPVVGCGAGQTCNARGECE